MPDDRLPSPDLLAEPVKDAGAAAALANDASGQHARAIFTEYRAAAASPDTSDTRTLLQTIARLEAAVRDAPSQVTAGLLRGLAEIATAITQIERVLSANEAPAPDVHFAVEHIQDIAMALRSRDVEAALCDTLDAAIREVGDAIVRGDAAAARTQSAAALLRELAHQINQMIALGDDRAAAAATERIEPTAAVAIERFDNTSHEPPADSVDAPASDAEQQPVREPLPLVAVLPDKQAAREQSEDQLGPFEPVSSSLLCAPDIEEDALPAGDQPSEFLEIESSASILAITAAATDAAQTNVPAAAISEESPLDIGAQAPKTPRAAANGPLAALNALSDEEIIALFS